MTSLHFIMLYVVRVFIFKIEINLVKKCYLPLTQKGEEILSASVEITRVAIWRYLCIEKWVNYAQFVGFLVYLKLNNTWDTRVCWIYVWIYNKVLLFERIEWRTFTTIYEYDDDACETLILLVFSHLTLIIFL